MHSLTSDAGFDHARLLEHQRLNHFPRHVELTRKRACGFDVCCAPVTSGLIACRHSKLVACQRMRAVQPQHTAAICVYCCAGS